jgi:putrescine transport system permease protein
MNRRPMFLYHDALLRLRLLLHPDPVDDRLSFNDSRLATVWGGFSTKWYFELFKNDQVIDAAILSLKIAVTSATFATILGTMAGIALARFRSSAGAPDSPA